MKVSCAVLGLVTLLCVGCGSQWRQPALHPSDPVFRQSKSQTAETPFKGDLEGSQTLTPLDPPFGHVAGAGDGQRHAVGPIHGPVPAPVNFATSRGVGTYTFTAANGDTLTADFTGQAQPGPITSIVEQAVITGGTGRFAGATGSFTVRRLFDRGAGTATGSFVGTISTANGPAS